MGVSGCSREKPEDLEETYSLLTYDLEEENSTENLYIVEDSELDLGLLDNVIRNMPRMMEILEDYLSWHLEKLGEEAAEEEKEQTEGESEEAKKDPYRKEHYFLFGGRKGEQSSEAFGGTGLSKALRQQKKSTDPCEKTGAYRCQGVRSAGS